MKINQSKRLLIWFAILIAVFHGRPGAQAQGTLTRITFDPLSSPILVNYYEELGVAFTAMPDSSGYRGFGRIANWESKYGLPSNGTAYIEGSPFGPIVVSLLSGGAFGLVSVDLAESTTSWPYPATVSFVGYRSDNSSVLATFTTDGIMNIPGTPDFQTFYFGADFRSGLVRVEIPTGSPSDFHLDNLVLRIPEPAPWALVLLGTLIFAIRCCHQTQSFQSKPIDLSMGV